jgi:hypothetical protein
MSIACWIPKATDTHLEHVILTAFQWQKSLGRTRLRVMLYVNFLPCLFTLKPRSFTINNQIRNELVLKFYPVFKPYLFVNRLNLVLTVTMLVVVVRHHIGKAETPFWIR